MIAPSEKPFWLSKTLQQLSQSEWESLCDGCGQCCLQKLQDENTDIVYLTAIRCRLLDPDTRRCRDYANRLQCIPDCVNLTPENVGELDWLPDSCAYRRLAAGRDLADWHPLYSSSASSVVEAGFAIEPGLPDEDDVEERHWEDYITSVAHDPNEP